MISGIRCSFLHTWARAEDGGMVTIGITNYAQYQLGELQYVGLPRVGSAVAKDRAFGEVESTKTASDLYAPCSGTVTAVNTELVNDPALINREPYGAGWIIRITPSDPTELDHLLDEDAYIEVAAADH